jgi:hypothetical protein
MVWTHFKKEDMIPKKVLNMKLRKMPKRMIEIKTGSTSWQKCHTEERTWKETEVGSQNKTDGKA